MVCIWDQPRWTVGASFLNFEVSKVLLFSSPASVLSPDLKNARFVINPHWRSDHLFIRSQFLTITLCLKRVTSQWVTQFWFRKIINKKRKLEYFKKTLEAGCDKYWNSVHVHSWLFKFMTPPPAWLPEKVHRAQKQHQISYLANLEGHIHIQTS